MRRWQASLFGPAWLAFVIVAAAVLEWFLVTERMSYSSAGLERAWKGVSLAMASFALLSLWCVHYLDPGVIPPNPRQDEDVRWYLSQNRPVVDVRFSEGGRELVKRFAKDFRGQTIKTIIPAERIDPENPENPALTTGAIPGFSEHCWTYRYCVTCNIWRPPARRTAPCAATAWRASITTAPSWARASRSATSDGSSASSSAEASRALPTSSPPSFESRRCVRPRAASAGDASRDGNCGACVCLGFFWRGAPSRSR